MNDLAAAAILGIVQGLTEFLPVSSTAHLVLISDALGLDPARFGLSFDVALHLGTALAVLLYFARTWLELASDVVHLRLRMPFLVIVGTLPAALAGVAFQSQVETGLRAPAYIAAFLIIGSIIFVAAERFTVARRPLETLGFIDAVVMGVAQAIALLRLYPTEHARESTQFQPASGYMPPPQPEAPSPQPSAQQIVTPAAPVTSPAQTPPPKPPL